MVNAKLIKTRWGFYQRNPMPSQMELEQYYEQKYFQDSHGQYAQRYDEEELAHLRLKANLIFDKAKQLVHVGPGVRLYDVGCGEGWFMEPFFRHGCEVRGVDFSSFGINKFHPHLVRYFGQGDIYQVLARKIQERDVYDIIILSNVIEHVIDPEKLLQGLHRILSPGGLMIIHAPNDFSAVQLHALTQGYIDRAFWLDFEDHLSFFNKESMENFVTEFQFSLNSVVADYPIEFNLLSEHANYVRHPDVGSAVHCLRMRTDNFLADLNRTKLLAMREILGSMGVGRGLTYYFTRG